jgi:alpha-amylase
LLSFLFIGILAEDCSNLNGEYGCNGDQREYPSEWDERSFQTPPKDDTLGNYRETYQDMHYLVGYAQLLYSSDKKVCTINFITRVNPKLGTAGSDYKILYTFGTTEQESNSITLTSDNKFPDGMPISARVLDNNGNQLAKLVLEDEYFMWDNPTVNQGPQYEGGQKGAIVELFGWPFDDIAEECEFLGKAGYMAVKVFPASESILTFDTVENGELNPWWFLYQPVSYRLHSRMGDKKQLKNMINTCRQHGVRVYADAVINHMAGNGNDMYADHRNNVGSCVHWGPKAGSAGSPWWTTGWQYENNAYTGKRPGLEFPSVPYTASDFHCERSLNSWTDANILNTGWLSGLTDLNTEKEYVQQRIADYITDMLSMGVSGIRVDAAKHISPADLAQIFKKLKDNLGGGELPDDFTAYLEVLFGGEKDLLMCGGGDYSYGSPFVNKLKAAGLSDGDVDKIKIWGSDYPKEFPICGYWEITPKRHAIGLDCHDDQNPGSSSRDMGDKGSVYIKERNVEKHRNFNIEMFTRTDADWKIKLLLSSYSFMNNGAGGFPDGKSDCSACTGEQCKNNCNKSVPYQKAYNPSSTGYDAGDSGNWKEGTYTRVHRDQAIINAMRQWMGLGNLSSEQLFSTEKLKAKRLGL